jgi:hypothetical protein
MLEILSDATLSAGIRERGRKLIEERASQYIHMTRMGRCYEPLAH